MKKRITSVILALCMTLSLLPMIVWAEETVSDGTSLQDKINAASGSIKLDADVDLSGKSLTIPADREITLDLNGHQITASVSPVVAVEGKLTVTDSTASAAPAIGADDTVTYSSGSITAGDGRRDAVWVRNGGTFTLETGTVKAGNLAVCVDGIIEGAGKASKAVIRGGYVEAQESALVVRGQGAGAEIAGGVLLSRDNAVVSGNGQAKYAGTKIGISGGTLIGKIKTPGYIACGIYHPQKGELNISSQCDIRAGGGVGILMRGGTVSVTDTGGSADQIKISVSGSGSGWVGDAKESIKAGQTIVIDRKSGYYDGGNMAVKLSETLAGRLKPDTYCPDGFKLKSTVNADGTVSYSVEKTDVDTHLVTFDAQSGSAVAAQSVTGGGKVTKPADPTRSGYTFGGWYKEAACTTAWKFDTDTVTADITLYAKWAKVEKPPVDPDDEDEYRIYGPGSISGGRVYISHTTAEPGTRVTIELRPWRDYELNWISAVNLDTDRELRLTERYSDEYTFIMPAGDVEVDAAFYDRYYYYSGTYYVQEEEPVQVRPVKWYYSNGRIYHVTDGLVPYGSLLTRDMLLSVLYNMDPASTGDPTAWATNNGIIPDIYTSILWGTDKPINREQTAMILFCYAQHMGYNTAQRTDLTGYADYRQIRDIARPAVSWARAVGIISGSSATTLSPQAVLTCDQANSILSRFSVSVARQW